MSISITLVNHFVGKTVVLSHLTDGDIIGKVTEVLAQGVTIVNGDYNENTSFIPWPFVARITHSSSLIADDFSNEAIVSAAIVSEDSSSSIDVGGMVTE